MTRANALLAIISATLLSATSLAAQQPAPAQPDTARPKTTREIVFDKLRKLNQSEVRDTTTKDSLAKPVERTGGLTATTRAGGQQAPQSSMEFPMDSTMEALAKLEGMEATQYRGATAVFRADSNNLVLFGAKDQKAGVVREGESMTADSLLTFDQNSSVACGFGKPVLSGGAAASPVESQEVCYDTRNRIGVAKGARTQVSQGANWFVNGDLYYKGGDLYGHSGSFTDCSLPYPHYHFAAGEVKVVNNNVMVARNVTLNFGDVPVFWLPFMMQSLKQGRRSGILMPQFSVNDIVRRNSSYNRRISNVGFYWAISDMLGSRIAMDWWANNYTALEGSFDYNLNNKFMSGGATLKRFWRSNGSKEFSVAAQHSWAPDERTNIQANVQYATSTSFVRESSFDPNELRQQIMSTAGLSRRFNWGSLSLQSSRNQDISTSKVDYILPSLGVNFSTVTLFPAVGETHWFNNGTWTSSAQFRRIGTAYANSNFDPSGVSASVSSALSLGKLSWSQSLDANQDRRPYPHKTENSDTAISGVQTVRWNTGLNYTQRIIGTSTFTPSVNLSQDMVRADTLPGNPLLKGPMRMNVSASLKADLFGFWPGIGPMAKLRHKITPTFQYSYSPASSIDSIAEPLRARVFGYKGTSEQNRITIGINQTIEGKYKEDAKRDTANADSAAVDSTSLDPSKPRRLPQARKVTILSLGTDAVVYDFAAAKAGGTGIQTTQISNTINSDLLRGLQLTITHELFKPDTASRPFGAPAKREWGPRLSRVSASFQLSNNAWLFRFLGLGRKTTAAPPTGSEQTPTGQEAVGGIQPTGALHPEYGVIGTRSTETQPPPHGATGAWNASFNLTIERPQPLGNGIKPLNNSMMMTNVTFQPTAQWNVSWQTGYSFSNKNFTDHSLRFTRQMHDWDANFDFVKAQNGNFSFLFNVRLRANPDIKFDYNQHTNIANRRTR